MRIIDLSEFNDVYDWGLVKSNVDLVILRIGYRGSTSGIITYDKKYKEYRMMCESYGIPFGLYYFPACITPEEAKEEADFVIRECDGMVFHVPVFADSEQVYRDAHGRADKLTKKERTALLMEFCDRLQSKGVPAGVYASTSWFKDRVDDSMLPYTKWVAQYAPKCEYPGDYLMWQYTSSATIPGINGNVDMSVLKSEIPVMGEDKAQKVLEEARRWIGTKETPAGSNNVVFNTDYYGRVVSGSAYPWCCAFVWDVFRMAGLSELFYGGKKTAYCPTVESYYRSIGRFFDYPQVGDLALFNWNGGRVAQHIGIVESVDGNNFVSIEGNTSVTSNDNGGSVMRRQRKVSQCTGFARPNYGSASVPKQDPVNTTDYPTLRVGDAGAWVNLCQNAMTLRGYPVEVDGTFDNEMRSQVVSFQINYHLMVDGVVGPQTWAALFS